jgi:hypothetical protein
MRYSSRSFVHRVDDSVKVAVYSATVPDAESQRAEQMQIWIAVALLLFGLFIGLGR